MVALSTVVGDGIQTAVGGVDGEVVYVRKRGKGREHDVISAAEGAWDKRPGGRIDPEQEVVIVLLPLTAVEQAGGGIEGEPVHVAEVDRAAGAGTAPDADPSRGEATRGQVESAEGARIGRKEHARPG